MRHPRLQWGTRVLEIWRTEPRARLTLRFNRLSSAAPEIFYVAFLCLRARAAADELRWAAFTPFEDQLLGTCRDYFAIDGWADYVTPDGRWLWVSRDAPLVTFGASPTLAARTSPPEDVRKLRAMTFNNFWYTNFAADEHGIMEFQFDLVRPAGERRDKSRSWPKLFIYRKTRDTHKSWHTGRPARPQGSLSAMKKDGRHR